MNELTIHSFRFVFLKSPPSCPSPSSLFFSKYIYVWLCWVFVALVLLWLQGVEAALRFGTRTPLCGGVSCRAAQALGSRASGAVACGLSCLWHVESSRTRDRTPVPCTGRQMLNH